MSIVETELYHRKKNFLALVHPAAAVAAASSPEEGSVASRRKEEVASGMGSVVVDPSLASETQQEIPTPNQTLPFPSHSLPPKPTLPHSTLLHPNTSCNTTTTNNNNHNDNNNNTTTNNNNNTTILLDNVSSILPHDSPIKTVPARTTPAPSQPPLSRAVPLAPSLTTYIDHVNHAMRTLEQFHTYYRPATQKPPQQQQQQQQQKGDSSTVKDSLSYPSRDEVVRERARRALYYNHLSLQSKVKSRMELTRLQYIQMLKEVPASAGEGVLYSNPCPPLLLPPTQCMGGGGGHRVLSLSTTPRDSATPTALGAASRQCSSVGDSTILTSVDPGDPHDTPLEESLLEEADVKEVQRALGLLQKVRQLREETDRLTTYLLYSCGEMHCWEAREVNGSSGGKREGNKDKGEEEAVPSLFRDLFVVQDSSDKRPQSDFDGRRGKGEKKAGESNSYENIAWEPEPIKREKAKAFWFQQQERIEEVRQEWREEDGTRHSTPLGRVRTVPREPTGRVVEYISLLQQFSQAFLTPAVLSLPPPPPLSLLLQQFSFRQSFIHALHLKQQLHQPLPLPLPLSEPSDPDTPLAGALLPSSTSATAQVAQQVSASLYRFDTILHRVSQRMKSLSQKRRSEREMIKNNLVNIYKLSSTNSVNRPLSQKKKGGGGGGGGGERSPSGPVESSSQQSLLERTWETRQNKTVAYPADQSASQHPTEGEAVPPHTPTTDTNNNNNNNNNNNHHRGTTREEREKKGKYHHPSEKGRPHADYTLSAQRTKPFYELSSYSSHSVYDREKENQSTPTGKHSNNNNNNYTNNNSKEGEEWPSEAAERDKPQRSWSRDLVGMLTNKKPSTLSSTSDPNPNPNNDDGGTLVQDTMEVVRQVEAVDQTLKQNFTPASSPLCSSLSSVPQSQRLGCGQGNPKKGHLLPNKSKNKNGKEGASRSSESVVWDDTPQKMNQRRRKSDSQRRRREKEEGDDDLSYESYYDYYSDSHPNTSGDCLSSQEEERNDNDNNDNNNNNHNNNNHHPPLQEVPDIDRLLEERKAKKRNKKDKEDDPTKKKKNIFSSLFSSLFSCVRKS